MALKAVVITGCSEGGIGSALALAFQKRNLQVFATARDPSKMAHLSDLPNVTLLQLNPTSNSSVEEAAKVVRARTSGRLDYLVNNAGQTMTVPTLDIDIDKAKEMYEINVWGMIRVTQALSPLVIASRGSIVNISSVTANMHVPWVGIYGGSKAAVNVISDTLRLELAPFGVKVVTVITGAISTNVFKSGKDFKLPADSYYANIEDQIAARARGEDGVKRMDPTTYAEKVVTDILAGANGETWRGAYASIIRFMSSYLPSPILDVMAVRGTGLEVMKI
ncbi:MAG: hypothetical protein Q9214_003285 [Letrouitia sp. 1 TL-2023]